ncbi:hypothetical protein FKM82_003109 [Ascaphus truei]
MKYTHTHTHTHTHLRWWGEDRGKLVLGRVTHTETADIPASPECVRFSTRLADTTASPTLHTDELLRLLPLFAGILDTYVEALFMFYVPGRRDL